MPVLHYFGADAFSQREAYDQLRADHDGDGALAANTLVLDGPRTTPAEVAAAAMTAPFLADHRLVRVDGLCRPHDTARNAPAGKRRRRGLGDWEGLADRLQDLPPSTLLVFVDGEIRAGNPMKRLLGQIAHESQEFKPAKGQKLDAWVRTRAQRAGLHLTARAQRALVARVGRRPGGAGLGDREAAALRRDDDTVDEHVIERICPRNLEAEVWDLTDAVGQGRPDVALRALETLRHAGENNSRLLRTLANQMRRIAVAQDILAQGGGRRNAVRQRFRMGHPYPAQKLAEQARRVTPAQAAAALSRIRDCDAAIQRYRRDLPGGLHDDVALELLVVDLAAG